MPDLTLELEAGQHVAGVDEAGRGPWAGPVVAAAIILPTRLPSFLTQNIDDSKKLSKSKRETLYRQLTEFSDIGIGISSVSEIDYTNILQATMTAMRRALSALSTTPKFALIDGNHIPSLPFPAKAIVKGDRRSLSIAGASIVAKVTRDKIMCDLSAEYPGYGWERNKGYGTAEHRHALAVFGPTNMHRLSFAPIARLATLNK